EFAAIERKMPGRELESHSLGAGWAWPELDLIDARAGGAPIAQRDALKLLAVFLQHTDSKADQQKLLCLDDEKEEKDKKDKKDEKDRKDGKDPKGKAAPCRDTFMMIHDVGLTFGTASLLNLADKSGANLRGWSTTPIWKDAAHCIGN